MKGIILFVALAAATAASTPALAVQQSFAQNTDTIHAGESKIVSVNCPSGFFASGGGYSIDSGSQLLHYVGQITSYGGGVYGWTNVQANVPNLTITLNQPTTGTGDGWAIGGSALHDTAVTVYAMCIARG